MGGLFFDDMEKGQAGFDAEAFTRDVGQGIMASWAPIVGALSWPCVSA